MEKRPYVGRFTGVHPALKFTDTGVEDAIHELNSYWQGSEYLDKGDDKILIDLNQDKKTDKPEMSITIPLDRDKMIGMNDTFRDKIGVTEDELYDAMNYVFLVWNKENDGLWYVSKFGKPSCGDYFLSAIEKEGNHGQCPCPGEFKRYCEGTILILTKYSSK